MEVLYATRTDLGCVGLEKLRFRIEHGKIPTYTGMVVGG
ncbi:hypothetical protein DOT_5327 [Desulfosporosinus sp. OT]|nr:hypothetical protein DOT_5327 [Desulfosporosinus sp. OT]